MITINILRVEFLVITNLDSELQIQIMSEEFNEQYSFYLSKSQVEILSVILSTMAKQLD